MRFDGDEREGIGGERERERVMGDTRFRFFFVSFFARENKYERVVNAIGVKTYDNNDKNDVAEVVEFFTSFFFFFSFQREKLDKFGK